MRKTTKAGWSCSISSQPNCVTHTLSLLPASFINTTGNFQLAPYFSKSPIRGVLVLKIEV